MTLNIRAIQSFLQTSGRADTVMALAMAAAGACIASPFPSLTGAGCLVAFITLISLAFWIRIRACVLLRTEVGFGSLISYLVAEGGDA